VLDLTTDQNKIVPKQTVGS